MSAPILKATPAATKRFGCEQPALGILATAIIIVVSLAFISLFDFPTFSGWLSYSLMCVIPAQIVVSVTWRCNHPWFLASLKQPLKGFLLVLFTVLAGVIVGFVLFKTVDGSVNPPTPMVIMCIIDSVIVTFWLAIMFGGWPFNTAIKSQLGAGIAMLISVYLVTYALFRIFFNYGFMKGSPVYVASLDPHGLFNAWYSLVFFVTFSAVMFLALNFDMWPLNLSPGLMKQPVLGIVWTLLAMAITAIAMYIGIGLMGMDPVVFMVRVPIPFIFGTIVVHNMLQGTLFAKVAVPLRGVLNTMATILVGAGLAWMYGSLSPHVTGVLKAGPPAYDYEIWVASALLAVTFPFLIFYAEFFNLWPFKSSKAVH